MATRVVKIDGLPLPARPGCHPWSAPIAGVERSIAIGYARCLNTAKRRLELVGVHRKGIVRTRLGIRFTEVEGEGVVHPYDRERADATPPSHTQYGQGKPHAFRLFPHRKEGVIEDN